MPSIKVLLWVFGGLVAVVLLELCIYFLLPAEYQPGFFRFSALSILFLAYAVIIIDLLFLIPTIKGAIYFPSNKRQIAVMLELAGVKKGECAVDIGSGDGRVVAALAQSGARVDGIELNPILVWYSKWKYGRAHQNAHFWCKNLWQTNFSEYDVVVLFGMTYIMHDLERKLQRELKPGARVVANSFPFPTWKATQKKDSVYLYTQT